MRSWKRERRLIQPVTTVTRARFRSPSLNHRLHCQWRNVERAVNDPMKNNVSRIARQFTSREHIANIAGKVNANFNRDGLAHLGTIYSTAVRRHFHPRDITGPRQKGRKKKKTVETMILRSKDSPLLVSLRKYQ